jgi:putative methyltransferase (TIGR04325 family)
LNFPPSLVWQVYDLPKWTDEGRRLVVSGALHFFDPPVYHMVADLPEKPIQVLINRSPLIAGPTKAAVQDNNNLRTARVRHTELIAAFEAIGYELMDSWQAAELAFKIIGKPEFPAPSYSGLYFRLKTQA